MIKYVQLLADTKGLSMDTNITHQNRSYFGSECQTLTPPKLKCY